ncbi:MAG: hypothetical protein E7647_00195 [Ruminococcaceae bacterium]|nr:hypothetical protein [Oscillospiraceae bacterium]
MEEMMLIMFAPLFLCALVFVIIGIANHGRREMIYDEFAGVFGPFKAYIFAGCTMGPALIIAGIIGFFFDIEISIPLSFLAGGLFATLLGILIGWLTARKAPGSGAVGYMFLAGLGTLWHIELVVMRSFLVFFLIFRIFSRSRYDY